MTSQFIKFVATWLEYTEQRAKLAELLECSYKDVDKELKHILQVIYEDNKAHKA